MRLIGKAPWERNPNVCKFCVRWLERLGPGGERIASAFPEPPHEVLPIPAFEQALAPHVGPAELERLKPELWRATIANVAYQHLRNPAIHGFGSGGGIVLSETMWNGQPVPPLGYGMLRNCVRGLIVEARRRSEANGQWFGNDAIVYG
jgi:hypothetical protein